MEKILLQEYNCYIFVELILLFFASTAIFYASILAFVLTIDDDGCVITISVFIEEVVHF